MARSKHHHPDNHECPTPGKRGYDTKKKAKVVLRRLHLSAGHGSRDELAAYKCRCGQFHIGHKMGTTYKKLKKAGELREQQPGS